MTVISFLRCFSFTDYFHSQQDLGARDCLFLGKHAFNRGYFDTAVQWAEAAISKVESGDETLGKREILSFLDMAVRVVRSKSTKWSNC